MTDKSLVAEFYYGKTLFLTGGTGFLGLCLIEKILRTLPDVEKVYLLMRPKKGKEIAQRLQDLTKDAIFDTLLQDKTREIFDKLVPVSGDVGEDDLGLSAEDRKMLTENVDLVIHSAATLDFQLSLKPTVSINLLGTRKVVQLCKEMKKIKAFVHVSSAYVNSFLLETDEKLYPEPEDPEKVITLVATLSDSALSDIEKKLLGDHPNTYTFTKHLAEHEVNRASTKISCAIVRPSMITAAWKEPHPGWTSSKNGPQGFLMGASRGIVRRLPIAVELIADYIPVDVVVNELLVAGYEAAKQSSGLQIYHCTSSTTRPFTWGTVEGKINSLLHQYPLKSAIWYPYLKFVSSIWMFKISAIFVHFLPAYILDFMIRLSGGKPILVRLHKNVYNSLSRLERFIFTEWKFHNPNTIALNESLNNKDKQLFFLDLSTLMWDDYFNTLALGVRTYLNKEPLKTIPAAKGKDTILMLLHLLLQGLIVFGGWYAASSIFGCTLSQAAWSVPLTYFLYNLL